MCRKQQNKACQIAPLNYQQPITARCSAPLDFNEKCREFLTGDNLYFYAPYRECPENSLHSPTALISLCYTHTHAPHSHNMELSFPLTIRDLAVRKKTLEVEKSFSKIKDATRPQAGTAGHKHPPDTQNQTIQGGFFCKHLHSHQILVH